MSGIKWIVGCAAVGWGALWCLNATAQEAESPFAEEPTATPAVAEKSVLKQDGEPKIDYGKALDYCQCVDDFNTGNSRKIERVLRGPLSSSGIEFSEAALNDVVNQLQDEYRIPIHLDTPALDAAGIRADEQVTVSIHNVSLQSALRLIFRNLQLTSIIEDEVLIITTPDEAAKHLKVCVYDVRGIVGGDEKAMDALIDAILGCIVTESWSENGGANSNIHVVKPGLLVVSQTQAAHDQIRSLLATIRAMQKEAGAPAPDAANNKPAAADGVVTRSYVLQLDLSKDAKKTRAQVHDLITASLPDEVWKGRLTDGQAVLLTVLHDRVVVRQTPAVQEKVKKILADSGVATVAVADQRGGTGGGGGGVGGGGFGGGGGGNGGGGFFNPSGTAK